MSTQAEGAVALVRRMRAPYWEDPACRGTDPGLWVDVTHDHESAASRGARLVQAQAICAGCTERPKCAAWAEHRAEIGEPESGIWAGRMWGGKPIKVGTCALRACGKRFYSNGRGKYCCRWHAAEARRERQ